MTTDASEYVLVPRPIERLDLPKAAARANFQRKLETQFGLEPEVAEGIARIVVNPDRARHQLDYVQRRRLVGGTATVLTTEVFSLGVSVSPVNPRETPNRIYPLEYGDRQDIKPPLKLSSRPDGQPVLRITGRDSGHTRWTIQQAAADLKNNSNRDLREPIWNDGVREPLLLFVAEFVYLDGSPSIICPMAGDGSSRSAWCHEFLGIESADVVDKWADADARAWRGKIGEILAVQDLPAGEADDDALAAHRCLVAPAHIVLKVEPLRGSDDLDVVGAYRSMVGAIHVAAPEPWGRNAENDETANAVIDQLAEEELIDEQTQDYLAGLMTPAQAEEEGFDPRPDVRAAVLMKLLNDDTVRAAVSKAVCRVKQQSRLGRNDRPSIAAELAFRACRSAVAEDLAGRRSTLDRGFLLSEWRGPRLMTSDAELDELRDRALEALEEDPDSLSEAALELGIYGLYWLATTGSLKRETPRSASKLGVDKVMELMMSRSLGVHQLYQIVFEAREGGTRFSVVDEDGAIFKTEAGDGRQVDDRYLRETFNVRHDAEQDGPAPDDDDENGAEDVAPRELLRQMVRRLVQDADGVGETVKAIRMIPDGDRRLVDVEGIPHGTANRIAAALSAASDEVKFWGRQNQQRTAAILFENRAAAFAADLADDEEVA